METALIIVMILMILGSIFTIHAPDLLASIVSFSVVGFGLVICFLLLKAPDLAIVQIVVETITLVIMVSVLVISRRKDLEEKKAVVIKGKTYFNTQQIMYFSLAIVAIGFALYFFVDTIYGTDLFGDQVTRMSTSYIKGAVEETGSVNLVTGILFDFRGYDTLGEATILLTAVLGVLTILRLKGKKG